MSSYGPITSAGAVTTYLPLATPFPISDGCSSIFIDNTVDDDGLLYFNDPKYASVAHIPSCLPPEVSSWWYQATQTVTTTLLGGYSMNCPAAYTTAYSNGDNTLTTTVGCCPSSYTYQGNAAGELWPAAQPLQCYSIMSPSQSVTWIHPNNQSSYITESAFFTDSYTFWGVQVNGYIFPSPTSTAASTSSSSASHTSSTTSSPTSASSSTAGPIHSSTASSGMSSGAKIGVGVGVALGLIGILALVSAFFMIRRRKQAYTAPPEHPSPTYQDEGGMHKTAAPPQYDDQQQQYELHASEQSQQYELQTSEPVSQPAEMP